MTQLQLGEYLWLVDCNNNLMFLLFQVAMGYSHSLVIARQETDQEKEKLKKLPEYNPRTLWFKRVLSSLSYYAGASVFPHRLTLLTRSPV